MFEFEVFIAVMSLTAILGYINKRFIALPQSMGVMLLSIVLSILALSAEKFNWIDLSNIKQTVHSIKFNDLLLHSMLSLMLFAGALNIDIQKIREVKWPALMLATISVLLSTFFIGEGLYYTLPLLGLNIDLMWCLLFGALISPTDPIAVMDMIKRGINIPTRLEYKISAEALFNDGVGVVVYITILGILLSGEQPTTLDILKFMGWEIAGGVLFGLIVGYFGNVLLKSIDSFDVEVMLTLGLAGGSYIVADTFKFSAPITVVILGLMIGNSQDKTMSYQTKKHLNIFWHMLDEMMNAVLFLLMGIELMVIDLTAFNWSALIATIAIVILARFGSVLIPISLLNHKHVFEKGTIPVLTWGGLRGGISVALALSLPESPYRNVLIATTYGVVVFSVIVQGGTLTLLVNHLFNTNTTSNDGVKLKNNLKEIKHDNA